MSKYTIYIEDLHFFTIIGILGKERFEAQKVSVDTVITYEKKQESFINYAEVAIMIEETMQKEQFYLLEDALEKLSIMIGEKFPDICTLGLKITKPDILENCSVSVEIFRKY